MSRIPGLRTLQHRVCCGAWLIGLVGLALPLAAAENTGIDAPASGWAVQTYGVEHGLDSRAVTDLDLAPDGELWLGSFDGLLRFDGARFVRLSRREHPGLPSNRVIDLHRLADGDLWLRTENGQLRRWHGSGVDLPMQAGVAAPEAVLRTHLDTGRQLWAAAHNSLFRVHNRALTRVCQLPDAVTLLNFNLGGEVAAPRIWITTLDHGLWSCTDGTAVQVDAPELAALGAIDTLAEAPSGDLVLSSNGALWRWSPGQLDAITFPADAAADLLNSDPIFANSASGEVWVSTDDGVFRIAATRAERQLAKSRAKTGRFARLHRAADGAEWRMLGADLYRDGQRIWRAPRRITQLALDREGGVFVGTDGDGLFRLRRTPLTVLRPESTPQPAFTGLAPSRSDIGTIWAVALHGQRYRIHTAGNRAMELEVLARSPQAALWSVLETRAGELWDGGDYLCRWRDAVCDDSEAPAALRRRSGLPRDIRMLFEDSAGRLWVGSAAGLFVREADARWRKIDAAPAQTLRVALELPDGALLFGSNGAGLWRWTPTGMAAVGEVPSALIRSLYRAADGQLFLGSEDIGLIRARLHERESGPGLLEVARLDRSHGLPDDVIHQILPGVGDALWINSNRGVFRIEPGAAFATLQARDPVPLPVQAFDRRDGLVDTEGNGGFHAAGLRDASGRLWFPQQGGVVAVEVARYSSPPPPSPARIEVLDSHGVALADGALLAAGEPRSLQLNLSTPRYGQPERLRFRFRILGLDEDWSAPGAERSWRLSSLPPGSLRVQAQVADGGGPWQAAQQDLNLQFAPRFHESRAFYALLWAAALAFGVLTWRWRSHALRLRAQTLAEQVEHRTGELQREKQRVEESLVIVERQRRELAALDEAKSRFFTDLSHELRTPLSLIIGPAEHALAQIDGEPGPLGRSLRSIRGNAARLLELVNQILELARLESGVYRPVLQRGDLAATALAALEPFRAEAARRGISLHWESDLPQAVTAFDADALRRVLANLLGNALRHSPDGGQVELALHADGRSVSLSVSDHGPGIPPEDRQRIFDRYWSRSQGGSGIGLALVRELVQALGGSVVASEAPGGGARLQCMLPWGIDAGAEATEQPVSTAEPASAGARAPAMDHADAGQRAVVLVVEDEPELLAFLGDCLGTEFTVLCASDGANGARLARERSPDLIVSDLVMPGGGALALMRSLQEDEDTAAIPVVILSAHSAPQTQLQGLDSGAIEYLTKPFSPEILRARLRRLLDFRLRLREQLRAELAPLSAAPPAEQGLAGRVRQVVLAGLGDPQFGVDQLAAGLHRSRATLARDLRDAGLPPPSQWIRDLRLEQGARLLCERRHSVAEIAYAVGYASQSHFITRFRERYGSTPLAWLKQRETAQGETRSP